MSGQDDSVTPNPEDALAEGSDPLASLVVIHRLEVGPVRVEPRRISAAYTVIQADGSTSSNELVYRYEEDVFDPEEAASQNLAALITAQVALNYGLFCHQIVFHGPFDATDRKLLAEMAANTAREIYVKKFLEENLFLLGAAAKLPTVRQASYLRAELVFPEEVEAAQDDPKASAAGWVPSAQRIAVLASGGKDSLLSHGLLDELGLETHDVFVNEAGHHWHTALNAYRYLNANRPQTTARVWTSSDRIFSWMLRHLPFVRQDFARVRSDEYPIRLWTVAVFLFGALPVLRRRGIGRLVIGDEFDTTRRLSHQGITHYDGLYDQSRFFDEALTRYYRRKGWPLAQFSILRQAGALLIEKTLVERYPELQRHQVSCHASHVEGERSLPCGKCEKCRRIVGMLLAYGADPSRCGYSQKQIDACLESLAAHGVHQEAAGARHLAWMLQQRGLLPEDAPAFRNARPVPEVMKLRFHREASPVEGLPQDLRTPIFRLLMHHADGAVERTGRLWTPCEPLEPSLQALPYRPRPQPPAAPATADGGRGQTTSGATPRPYLLAELTWPRAKERFAECDTALLPVGAIEQHGYHLPLDTDSWDADYLCRRVAEACGDPKPLVLPLIPYGVSYHHDDFPGTLSINPETLAALVYDVGMAAARNGIRKLIIVNGHGGNAPTLQFAAQKINRDAHIFTCVDTGETSDADIYRITDTPNDVHAGEVETSTALATRPHLVDMDRATRDVQDFSSQYLDFSSENSVEWYAHTSRISTSGVMGDATAASVEKGERMWSIMVDHLVAFVESLKAVTLDQLHERRM